ncbi:hypothetical protein [Sutcliffiella cohnii]|uniref:hypothetical protein n=1 Tax=Sutcliffiella cohnii TaxID=33932 RepID=UPI002E22EB73|nr:hypothetical protein [Sutcliffiella cohnii]
MNDIIKGKIDYTLNKIIVNLIAFIFLGVFLYLERNSFDLPLYISLTPAVIALLLYLDLLIAEKMSAVEIQLGSKQVIYNKYYCFGLLNVRRIFRFTGNSMADILEHYKDDKQFTVDCINDLAGTTVFFHNK